MNRLVLRVLCLFLLIVTVFGWGSKPAVADTLTGVFSNPVPAGFLLNDPSVGMSSYQDDTGYTVIGTATPGGSACAPANTLCWGTAPDLDIPASEQYSQLVFTGSTSFDPNNTGIQNVGTISFLNGTSDTDTLIFGAALTVYDNGSAVGSYNVVINTTENQYSGTGLTQQELGIDADYISICGNGSNICGQSIEAYEAGEGGTGLLVDLTGNLVGDPMLNLDNAFVDPSQNGCTTCGVVGTEAALGTATPEPASLVLTSTAALLFGGFAWYDRFRRCALARR